MKVLVFLLTASWAAVAQTTLVDLRTQSKNVDFSTMVSTRPVTVGTAIPSTCVIGQMFFRSNAAAGANLYGCTAVNTWTPLNVQENEENIVTATSGSGAAYVASANCPQSLAFLQTYNFVPDVTNTVISPTLNLCGLGALAVKHNDSTNLVVGELQQGHVYPLVVNSGVTAFLINWEQLQADSTQSININRSGAVATIGYKPAVVPDKINLQTLTNFWDFTGGALRPPQSVAANLPAAAANTGKFVEVTDGASLCDVSTGGGSTAVLAISNGSSWIAPNCAPPPAITAATQGWLYPLDIPPSGNSGTLALTPNKVVLYAVQPKANYTVRRYSTLGTVTTGKGLTACMYTAGGSLIANSSSHYVGTGSAATPNMATGGPLSLAAGGYYFLAFTGEDAVTALNLNLWGTNSAAQSMMNVNSGASVAKCTQSSTGTGAGLACPSTCTVTADDGAAFMTGWVLLP